MRPRDLRPRAARVQLEVALPVPDGLVAAARARERAGEVEVGVGVVGRDVERAPIAADRLLDVAGVFVQRAEIVGGLRAVLHLAERPVVGRARLVIASHAVQQQAEIVPGGRVRRVDGDRKSTRLNSSHGYISYAVFCLKKKNT